MNSIKVFCPASVANVSCGFDILGFCLDGIGDEMKINKTANKGLTISKISGAKLPFDPNKNVAIDLNALGKTLKKVKSLKELIEFYSNSPFKKLKDGRSST